LVKYGDTHCPACRSADVKIEEVRFPHKTLVQLLGECLTCKHLWVEDLLDEARE
jgi:hypothetical protein